MSDLPPAPPGSGSSPDPDRPETPPPAASEEHRFPCDQCGADFRFDPEAGKLICDHCGNEKDYEDVDLPEIREMDFEAALRSGLDAAEMEETRVTACPNCGAQVEFSPDIHSTECPFCATPVVTDTGTHRHIKPKGVLPFQLEERAAHKAMTDWLGRLWFAPSGLKEYARQGRRLDGIYVPYWTYDAQTRSAYQGQRGTVYYVTRTVTRDGKPTTVREQRIRWTNVSGRVARFFDDILILGSRSLPKRYTDGLAPWDLGALQPYQPHYLAGFRAEGYTVDVEEGFDEAREGMDAQIRRDINADIGGDRQRISHVNTNVSEITFKHVLLPVWMAAYRYKGKSYRFVVNGQTGRVQGERPWSAVKIAIAVIIGLALAAGAAYLYSMAQK